MGAYYQQHSNEDIPRSLYMDLSASDPNSMLIQTSREVGLQLVTMDGMIQF